MDVTRILEADHRDVEALFAELDRAKGEERTPLIDQLATSLRAHMELEETVVYPGMAAVTGDEAVQEGETEHDLARRALKDVLRLAPDEPGFGAALEALKAGIEHHVEEEESDDFPELRSAKGKKALEEMATPFMQKRLELGMPMTADALGAAATRDELAQEAEAVGVDGASSMTKGELADTLTSAMG